MRFATYDRQFWAGAKCGLDEVQSRVTGLPTVRTLIVRDQDMQGVVGRGTFLNDLLQIAGGENVLQQAGWPEIDKEQLLATKPDVILHLLPGASDTVVANAKAAWSTMPLPEATRQRVYVLTDWYLLQGGVHVAETARNFATRLHPPTK